MMAKHRAGYLPTFKAPMEQVSQTQVSPGHEKNTEEKLTEYIRRLGRSVMGIRSRSKQQHDYLLDWRFTSPGNVKGDSYPETKR